MLPQINKCDMAGKSDAIEEHLRSCQGAVRAPLVYIIRMTILVQTYGDYPEYATPDDEMITRMLHLPPDENKLLLEQDAQSTRACTAEYEIDNRSVYDILGQICKDTDLYPYIKSISPRGMVEGHFMTSIPGGRAQIMSMQQH